MCAVVETSAAWFHFCLYRLFEVEFVSVISEKCQIYLAR